MIFRKGMRVRLKDAPDGIDAPVLIGTLERLARKSGNQPVEYRWFVRLDEPASFRHDDLVPVSLPLVCVHRDDLEAIR